MLSRRVGEWFSTWRSIPRNFCTVDLSCESRTGGASEPVLASRRMMNMVQTLLLRVGILRGSKFPTCMIF